MATAILYLTSGQTGAEPVKKHRHKPSKYKHERRRPNNKPPSVFTFADIHVLFKYFKHYYTCVINNTAIAPTTTSNPPTVSAVPMRSFLFITASSLLVYFVIALIKPSCAASYLQTLSPGRQSRNSRIAKKRPVRAHLYPDRTT